MTEFADGDKVKISIEGTVRGGMDREHRYCTRVVDKVGHTHYVYLQAANTTGNSTSVQKTEPAYKVSYAYEDADGDVFIRRFDGKWLDSDGMANPDAYPTRPLTLLTKPEA